ncbi:hypothetical protein HYH03_007925 [Edaphochlamys debaryana]|uniref:CGL160/ATPI domain-containing protein n=1 Tax=Edaphochlamys debaryana TaxID=47281 RepID=A0A835Y153_9CHLO|nr:hypothetical protein HYH03_007925 [Edaphochlamys debaryana]|eukprot:KAG2493998.1 hypothetical protein HYH03_007925 [Edaphochlamys debaryana]
MGRFARLTARAAAPEPQQSSENGSDNKESTSGRSSEVVNPNLKLPKLGYFALADTKAEVYSRAGSEKFDPAKRGGRYQPEFIWNTDWQTALQREESLRRKVEEAKLRPKEPSSGFLSLSRVAELDRMDVDLSDALRRKKQEEEELRQAMAAKREAAEAQVRQRQAARASAQQAQAAAQAAAARDGRVVPASMFTRKEAAKLRRVSGSAARTAVMVEVPALDAEKMRLAEEERKRYDQVKVDQQVWTLLFSMAGFAMTYASYTQDVAFSYVVGALGGFAYLRLLSKSVDAMGGGGDGLAGGMASQPRLLIPVILGLGYNRFNQLYADQLGVHLELLPMLVGFFTYKLAVVARQYKDVFDGKA